MGWEYDALGAHWRSSTAYSGVVPAWLARLGSAPALQQHRGQVELPVHRGHEERRGAVPGRRLVDVRAAVEKRQRRLRVTLPNRVQKGGEAAPRPDRLGIGKRARLRGLGSVRGRGFGRVRGGEPGVRLPWARRVRLGGACRVARLRQLPLLVGELRLLAGLRLRLLRVCRRPGPARPASGAESPAAALDRGLDLGSGWAASRSPRPPSPGRRR